MKHHTTENQDEVNNSSLYLDETGSNGISLLKRIEKYPDLPENEFIPIEYTHSNGHTVKNIYHINKLGQIKNIEKRIKRVIAADLFGNFICYESGKYISKNILSLSSIYSSNTLIKLKTPGEK
jgi:hypothetical protein